MVSSRAVLLVVPALLAAALVPVSADPAGAEPPSLPSGCTQATVGGAVTCTFASTGDVQSFTVPNGVTTVTLTAWGGHGATANEFPDHPPGGRGAMVEGTFPVSPGDALTVTVGADASGPSGGFGFGHGGASDQLAVGAGGGGSTSIADGATQLLVAGAGGGGGMTGTCGFGGAGGDAGQPGLTAAGCSSVSGGAGGTAGGEATPDGSNGGQGGFTHGGGGGGGGYRGGVGGQSGFPIGPNFCCTSSGGGGGGSSHADASGSDLSLSGLSDRPPGQNGQVTVAYLPTGPATQLVLSPATATVDTGQATSYAVTGYNSDGASLDLTADSVLSISPEGSCTVETCTPSAPGPHTVTASYAGLTATASLDVDQAPAFTSPDTASFSRGAPGSFSVTASGSPTPRLSMSGTLPAGLRFVDNGDGTGSITGTPSGRPGVSRVRLTADTGVESVSQRLRVQVVPLPGACANRFRGTARSDLVRGTPAGDLVRGRSGSDGLLGYAGDDCLWGGSGRDGLFGDRGADRLWGGSGADVIKGGPGRDVIHAIDGARDVVWCGPGRDTVYADPVDVLHGCETVRLRSPR